MLAGRDQGLQIDGDRVVAAAQILHERVAGRRSCLASGSIQPAHGPRPCLESAVGHAQPTQDPEPYVGKSGLSAGLFIPCITTGGEASETGPGAGREVVRDIALGEHVLAQYVMAPGEPCRRRR
jgi:hypothetical protein